MFFLIFTHYLPIPDNINSLHPHCLCYLDHCLTHLKKFCNITMYVCRGSQSARRGLEYIKNIYRTIRTILHDPVTRG